MPLTPEQQADYDYAMSLVKQSSKCKLEIDPITSGTPEIIFLWDSVTIPERCKKLKRMIDEEMCKSLGVPITFFDSVNSGKGR